MDVDDARMLSPVEWGMIQGFPRSYRWLYGQGGLSRTKVGQIIGNAVPPKVMTTVGRWLVAAGFGGGQWDGDRVDKPMHRQTPIGNVALPPKIVRTRDDIIRCMLVAGRLGGEAASQAMRSWPQAYLSAATVIQAGSLVLPHWALKKHRTKQSPLLREWRERQAGKRVKPLSATQERAMGLGQHNVEDDRHLLVQDTQLMARVRRRIERGDAYTGLSCPITGRPNAVWREWERSGASGDILA